MKLNAAFETALNAQINAELAASHTYLGMAAYFDAIDLPGFASWFRAQSQEETDHAMRLYDFVVKRGGKITLTGLKEPLQSFADPLDAITSALAMEQSVTAQIHALFELSQEHKEYSAQSLLTWFLDEQTEEEDSFQNIVALTKAAKGDSWNLRLLDKDLAGRSAA